MHEKICDIQNSVWKAYTEYRKTGDMMAYNAATRVVVAKYKGDPLLCSYATNIIISWMPIINKMAGNI